MRAKPYRTIRHDPDVAEARRAHGDHVEALLPVLKDVQARQGQLAGPALGAISDGMHLSDAHTYGVATFYSMLSTEPRAENIIRFCDGPVCSSLGGAQIRSALEEGAGKHDEYRVERTSCLGLCDRAPAALVRLEACGPLSQERATAVFEGWRGDRPDYSRPQPGELRIAMERIGHIDPANIDEALDAGAYESLKKALADPPADVLEAVSAAGLQGRGGAGFPTGRKWRMVAEAAGDEKYVVCNADESEPGSFKDRVLMEGDPHLMLEGMALAGYAVGARTGIIYIRGEYEHAAGLLERAIRDAEERGWLGERIAGSDFSFTVHVHRGAGAYICGEETALLESLEGKRGEPRVRPPYPTTHGFRGRPTDVNNVETFDKVPAIVARGPDWYRSLGTDASPGTKVFTVSGHVSRPGAFEAPFGITLRQVIDEFAGGMRSGSGFKLALTGGAAGTVVDAAELDVPLDYDSGKQGVALGAGAVIVLDQSVRVIDVLYWLLHFFEVESCGKCTPCREGTREARLILERLRDGQGRRGDLDGMARLSRMLRTTSLCGLGQSVAWPLDSALERFREELEPLERG